MTEEANKKSHFRFELRRISKYEPGGHRELGWFLPQEIVMWQRQRENSSHTYNMGRL